MVVDAKTREARLERAAHVFRAAVEAAHRRILRVAQDAEFGGEEDFVAAAADRAPDELLVGVRTVDVGGVEEVDAEVERAMDRRDRFGVVAAGVEVAHPHAAEADGGDFGTVATQLALLHQSSRMSDSTIATAVARRCARGRTGARRSSRSAQVVDRGGDCGVHVLPLDIAIAMMVSQCRRT